MYFPEIFVVVYSTLHKCTVLYSVVYSSHQRRYIYPYSSLVTPTPSPSSSIETTFPCLYNCMPCLLYTAVAGCLYNYKEPSVQLYRQGKGVSTDDDGGCLMPMLLKDNCIYFLVATKMHKIVRCVAG